MKGNGFHAVYPAPNWRRSVGSFHNETLRLDRRGDEVVGTAALSDRPIQSSNVTSKIGPERPGINPGRIASALGSVGLLYRLGGEMAAIELILLPAARKLLERNRILNAHGVLERSLRARPECKEA